jgi:hypothetical protein
MRLYNCMFDGISSQIYGSILQWVVVGRLSSLRNSLSPCNIESVDTFIIIIPKLGTIQWHAVCFKYLSML